MIEIFNSKTTDESISAGGEEFTVKAGEWMKLPFGKVNHETEEYATEFHSVGVLVIPDTGEPVFTKEVTAAGGLFLLFGVAFAAWIVVSIMNRFFS